MLSKVKVEKYIGRTIASDVFDMSTGEIFLTRDSVLTEEDVERLKEAEVDSLKFVNSEASPEQDLVVNTLRKDSAHTKEEALYCNIPSASDQVKLLILKLLRV